MMSLVESKKNVTDELIYKTETDSMTKKANLQLPKGKGDGEGINQEFGINRYTLLYIKQINKSLLYSTGNYIQYNYNRKESEKSIHTHTHTHTHIYITEYIAVYLKLRQHCK